MKILQLILVLAFLIFNFQPAGAVIAVKKTDGSEINSTAGSGNTDAINLEDMSRKEKRQLKKKLRKQLKTAIKKAKKDHAEGGNTSLLLAIILTILIPPLGVAVWEGGITGHFWISLILTILFYVPGLIYSLIIILR